MSRTDTPRYPADLTGLRFGKLIVLKATGERRNNSPMWLCQCDCGNTVSVRRTALIYKETQSCGCLRSDLSVQKKRNQTIIHCKSVLYCVWSDLVRKCTDPRNENYAIFGGRGIKMCDEWMENMDSFIDWSLANGYDATAPKGQNALDLIDPNGDYCPENCRWVDMKTQLNNTRKQKK